MADKTRLSYHTLIQAGLSSQDAYALLKAEELGKGALLVAKNLSDVDSAATARTNLGLKALAIKDTINDGDWSGTDLAVANGGTGASTAADARSNLGIPLANSFESSEQTLTADTTTNVAHGLGARPTVVLGYLRCKTADLNYSVGDEVASPIVAVQGGTDKGISVGMDATNVFFTVTDEVVLPDKTSATVGTITLANWRVILRAFR